MIAASKNASRRRSQRRFRGPGGRKVDRPVFGWRLRRPGVELVRLELEILGAGGSS